MTSSHSSREETFTSPFAHSPDPEKYARDTWFQHDFLKNAWVKYLEDPFESGEDLRGRRFEVVVHEDGLNVTIREV